MTSIPTIPVQPAYVQKPTRYIAPHLATSTPHTSQYTRYWNVIESATLTKGFIKPRICPSVRPYLQFVQFSRNRKDKNFNFSAVGALERLDESKY